MKRTTIAGLMIGMNAIALGAVAFSLTKTATPKEVRAITNNASVYLDVSPNDWWVTDVDVNNTDDGDVVIGAYAWKGETNTKIRGNRVKGFSNSLLFEFVFDLSSYDNILFFRGKDSLQGTWHNQTGDFNNFNSSAKNVFKSDNNNDWNIDYSARAGYYGNYFLS